MERWNDGTWCRRFRSCSAMVLFSIVPAFHLSAQVGHEPSHSPYHDIRRGGVGVITVGYLGGSRGGPGVGISDGPTGGLRYEVAFGNALGASLGIAYAQTTRFVVDPTKDSLSRRTGPFNTDVVLADVALQLALTGRKTWHGFAPYLGGAFGAAIGGGSPPDPTGYDFGTKLTVAPGAGLRWYPARCVSVRTDFRLVLWRLKYPLDYKNPSPDGSRVLPLTAPLTEWTAHPWITIGLGWCYTWQAIALGDVCIALPIAAALSAAAVQGVDPRIRRTAQTLGASAWRTAWAVAREARFALAAVITAAFGHVIAEIGSAMMVGGNIRGSTRTLTTAIALYTGQGDFGLALALGVILLVLALLVNIALQVLQGQGHA